MYKVFALALGQDSRIRLLRKFVSLSLQSTLSGPLGRPVAVSKADQSIAVGPAPPSNHRVSPRVFTPRHYCAIILVLPSPLARRTKIVVVGVEFQKCQLGNVNIANSLRRSCGLGECRSETSSMASHTARSFPRRLLIARQRPRPTCALSISTPTQSNLYSGKCNWFDFAPQTRTRVLDYTSPLLVSTRGLFLKRGREESLRIALLDG